MQDLRFVTTSDGFVILENAGEERFRVPLDDALREGSRQMIASTKTQPTSPKFIQNEYRSGKSNEQIASETAEPLDYVQLFTSAVQSELDYLTSRIQNTEMVFGTAMMPFSEIISMSFSDPQWRTLRKIGSWFVRVFQADLVATWKYEPKLNLLEPQDELARAISEAMQHSKVVELAVNPNDVWPEAQAKKDPELAVVNSREVIGQEAEVLTLLDEMRERRANLQADHSAVVTPDLEPELVVVASKPKVKIAPAEKASGKSRSSLPTWDEIIFGTNADS